MAVALNEIAKKDGGASVEAKAETKEEVKAEETTPVAEAPAEEAKAE